MKTFSVTAAISHGWGIFKNNKRTLVGATFVLMVAGALLNMAKGSFHKYGLSVVIVWAAIIIASVILKIGFLKLALKLEDGEPATVRELWMYSKLFLKYTVTALVFGLLFVVGLVLLIVPGLYMLATYGFAPLIVIDEYVTPREAFRRSERLTKGHRLSLLGFYLLILILEIIGSIPFLLGLLVTTPVTTLAYAHLYRELQKRPEGHRITA